jgi:two-component system nitrogen regulation sensor histidine kinase NtrY
MSEVEKGNLKSLKKLPSEVELRNLYLGFNSMVEGIKEQKKSISEISRMKTLIKLGRRVAHEVKNPLTPIRLSAEQVLKSLKDKREDYEETIEKSINFIIEEAEHLKKVSYGFLDFTHLDEINLEEFNLYDLVKEEISNFEQVYPQINFVVDSESESIKVVLDKIKIKQAIKNILTNSIEAIGEKKGSVQLELKEDKNSVIINIIDNGVGMTRKEIDLIFDEDYSTKEGGTGIGLYVTKRIVELHNGKVEIFSEKNKGTNVILNLQKNDSKT